MAKKRNRASDAQRTSVLQALDEAFAAGRLDNFEHFERTRTATKAKYIDELRPLVEDLRGANDDLGLGRDDTTASTRDPHAGKRHVDMNARRAKSNKKERRGILIGLTGALAALAAIGGFAIASNDGLSVSESGSGSGSSTEAVGPGPLHTRDGVSRLLEQTRSEFGGEGVDTMVVYGKYASLSEEDPADPDTRITYHFDGGWEERRRDPITADSTLHVDRIDAEDFMAAVNATPEVLELDPDETVTSHVTISADPVGDPEFRVSASEGEYGDLGTVVFGPDGQVREITMPD